MNRSTFATLVALIVMILSIGAAPSSATSRAPDLGGIDWRPCPERADIDCATVPVPIEWDRPGGATIDIAIARLKATDPGRRIGSLLINPGGPGHSGVQAVFESEGYFSADLRRQFDIVGFDPRGVARSKPVLCDATLKEQQYAKLFPTDQAELDDLTATTRKLGADCRGHTGPLIDHVDTVNVARDMDAIRVALGESKISYWGVSYGTLLGQMYAERYPARIRAMVLDSNMDHSLTGYQIQSDGTAELEASLGQFADWCARTADCALHGKDVHEVFDSLYAKAERGELTDNGRKLTPPFFVWDVADSMAYPLDANTGWYHLAEWLRSLHENSRVGGRSAHDDLVEGTPGAVTCQDYSERATSYQMLENYRRKLARLAPHTRMNPSTWAMLTGCTQWPTKVTNPEHRLKVSGAPPILVTTSRYDVLTPHPWAANVQRQIPGSVLLTYDGVGHETYLHSPCGRAATDRYLLTLNTPAPGTHCPAVWPSK
ncbi:alpha/beta fold hydrolase [Actinomadura sp. J1-007]|nr:alpha/beta fold hydrolase [Actinomadura sp. J1-007]